MAKRRKKSTRKSTSTLKVGKKTYKKNSCHTTKTAAKKKAKGIRSNGGTARVVKQGSRHCVFKGPKAKKRRA